MRPPTSSYDDSSAELPPTVPYNSWLGPLGPVTVLLALLGPLTLLLAPSNVLDRHPIVQSISRWVASKFPTIYMHADQSHIPQVVLLVDTLVLLCTLGIASVALLHCLVHYRKLLRRHLMTGPHPVRTYAVGALASPLFALVFVHLYTLPGVITETAEDSQGRSVTYALFCFFVPYAAGLFIGVAPLFVRLFVDAHLFSRPVTTSIDP